MFTRASGPQSIGGVLDSGFKLYAASIKQVFIITYIGALAGAIWGWFYQKSVMSSISETGTFDLNMPVAVTSYILMIIIGTIIMAAAIIRIREVHNGERTSLGYAMVAGAKRAPAVFGASFIYMLAFMGGSILLLIPGIWIGVMLAFAFYAAAADNKGPIESIKYSYGLVKGTWWRIAALLTIVMFIGMVFYFTVGFVAGIAAIAEDPADGLQPNILTDIIIVPLITGAISPMMYCLAYTAYEDLKLRKEGVDLAERIESLG